MVNFTASYSELERDFRLRDIPTDSPGFCDYPNFLVAESKEPSLLNNYAAFVAKRPYDNLYLIHARRVITKASGLLYEELLKHGRLGACVDISGILSRILDREGIWNFPIKGSLTVDFHADSGLSKSYFWSVDHGEFVAGHAWIFAPPYTVVDVSVKQQPYAVEKLPYLPDNVLSEDKQSVAVYAEDIVSPSASAEMLLHRIPLERQLSFSVPQLTDMQNVIPAISVTGPKGSKLKYSPVAIGMPDAPLEDMRNMDFNGKTPWELYKELFQGKLG